LHTPPADSVPRSVQLHSRRVFDSTETTSPGSKPRRIRPAPISAAIVATSRQL
jgi:hypothetical protein